MRLDKTRSVVLTLATITVLSYVQAQASPESEFVGAYTQRDVDSQAQLFLLDDNTFCFTFTGGSLDLLKAGRWKTTAGGAGITLQEIRAGTQLFPAIAKNLDRLGPPMVGINFDGYTLSNARSPVFAVTSADTPPATLRPLFPQDKSDWSGTYALPLMAPAKEKYFFIGDVQVDKYRKPLKLRVTQYKIGSYDTIRIGFDEIQATPAMNASAQLTNSVLRMGGSNFGAKTPLESNTITDVREQCVNPILFPDRAPPEQDQIQGKLTGKADILEPVKSFNLDVTAIKGRPIFGADDASATIGTDSLDDLIEAEQQQLQAAFSGADNGVQALEAFLQLAKELSGKKRIKRHAPLIVKLYAELLVAKNVKRQYAVCSGQANPDTLLRSFSYSSGV